MSTGKANERIEVTIKKGLVTIGRTSYALMAAVDRVGNFETDTGQPGIGRHHRFRHQGLRVLHVVDMPGVGIAATVAPTNGKGLVPGTVVQVSIEGRFYYRKLGKVKKVEA